MPKGRCDYACLHTNSSFRTPSFHGFSSDIFLSSSPSVRKSLVRISRSSFSDLYRTGFDGFVNTLTALSLVAAVLLLIFGNKGFWQSLVNSDVVPDYTMLTITAGVILVSGMMRIRSIR